MLLKFSIAVLFSVISISMSQVTEGCARYMIDQNNILRCVQCFYTMGLTSSYTCEYCKAPKVVADGICKLPAAYIASIDLQLLGNGQGTSTPVQISAPSSNSNLQTQQGQQITSTSSQQSQVNIQNQQVTQTQSQQNLNTNPNILPSWQNTNQAQSSFDNSWGSSQNSEFGSFGEQTSSQSYQPTITNPSANANPNQQSTASTSTSTSSSSISLSTPTLINLPNATQEIPQQNTNQITIHKYPQFPNCIDYDSGQCWACMPGYLLNLIINQCTTYVKPPTPILSSSTSTSSTSKDPQENCNIYSETESKCSECFRGYFWNVSEKICKEVDRLCNTYNPENGECSSCYNRYYLKSGKCIAA